MTNKLEQLADKTKAKLNKLGFKSPSRSVLLALLNIAYSASLRTEKGSFIRGTITFAAPHEPDLNPPLLLRADYPSFTAFRHRERLTAPTLVKLTRAIDNWSGALAVYGSSKSNLFVWGVLDQRVHENAHIHGERTSGFSNPGIVTITIEAVAVLTVTHGSLFLCALRHNEIVLRENDVLESVLLRNRIQPLYSKAALSISSLLKNEVTEADVLSDLYYEWKKAITRICIGLRRCGTGGSLILSSAPITSDLNLTHPLPYKRLKDALVLGVLDKQYRYECEQMLMAVCNDERVTAELVWKSVFAQGDEEDREDELTGAIKLVSSMATADGALLLSPTLELYGFGVKIMTSRNVATVYDGPSFMRLGHKSKKIDISNYGTRHGSMLRYCRADRHAVGIVVSQDGHVRVITRKGASLLLWSNVKLLAYTESVATEAREKRRSQTYRNKNRSSRTMGYTSMPKSLDALLSIIE